MDYKSWKKTKENINSTTRERFEKLKKEYGFDATDDNMNSGKSIVSGICYSPSCENTYHKQFRSINLSGPYCNECSGVNNRRGLLMDEFPEIAKSIRSEVDLTKLTCCSKKKVDFECPVCCSRCKEQHVWNTAISNRTTNGSGCALCANFLNCPCVNKDIEFCCYKCREIKPLTEKCVSFKICRLCRRKELDGNVKNHLKLLFSCTLNVMKIDPQKYGDLTLEYLENLYETQDGRCHISGIKMNAGTHQNWKMSIERVDESIGYMNTNCVLICSEFQSGYRQHTIENWDKLCSYVKGYNTLEVPDEQKLITEIIKAEPPKLPPKEKKRKTKWQVLEDGSMMCTYCSKFLHPDQFSPSEKGRCKDCNIKRKRPLPMITLIQFVKRLIHKTRSTSKRRKGDAKTHQLTTNMLINLYKKQNGRCAYSNIPLGINGPYQMSVERIDVKKGYIENNILLIILGLNVGDRSGIKKADDDREGFSGWNREKLLWAVEQNPRPIIPKQSFIKDYFYVN